MKIEENQIQHKEIAGKTSDGDPVVYICTHGGLHAFFSKKDNTIESLGMAPHVGIAKWMTEKKSPGIKWKESFEKSEGNTLEDLKKSQENQFHRFRNAIFAPVSLIKSEPNDNYLIYDTSISVIGIMHKDEIRDGLRSGDIDSHCLVRNLNLNEPAELLYKHKEFR